MGMVQRVQEASSFLSLPAELRNQIYEYVFQGWVIAIRPSLRRQDSLEADFWPVTTDPYQTTGRQAVRRADKPSNFFALLYTCRQTYAEARLLPYSMNTALCGEMPFPRAWLDDLHEQLAQIRSLQLCSHTPANITLSRTWLEVLPWFSHLKKIEVYWQLRVPPWGSEEEHLSTATRDEAEMRQKIIKATSAACDIIFHRAVVWEG
ncbi:hypothetical protein BU25DRAFT_45013 [Macroventuria anomochaeta]|uniref:Uncharacterized protein n=1 Tax=Macroventuria anomochaeta TaxID=301207 RepID=A0ACB6S1L4_9PLEO|nr:uncharacterized protein BU25DRAFT_45013 [Macroventuria anomochaeta]KAF2627838.1 hypothetical protein BU25DRAFT_45013 [Macroventuria anomochaeta]